MLQGSFDTFDFAEVLGMLSRKHQSGKLRLHYGTGSVELFLREGKLAYAESSEHGSPARPADSRERLEEACFEVLRWEHGSFEFHPGQKAPASRQLDAPVESVLAGARRRLEQWDRVQALVPSLEVLPRLAPQLPGESVVVTRAAWRVLAAVDGRRNGIALARILGISHYELSALLADLVTEGLLEVNPRPRVTVAAPAGGRIGSGMPSVRLPKPPGSPGPDGGEEQLAGTAAPETDAGADPADPPGDTGDLPRRLSAFRLTGRKVRPANG